MNVLHRGFGIAEIVVALSVFLILMVSVFQYSGSLYRSVYTNALTPTVTVFPKGLDMFRYSESVCGIGPDVHVHTQVDLSGIISSSTPVTSMHYLGNDIFILTTDSASTTEPDTFKILLHNDVPEILSMRDVGPGIQDSILLPPYLYIANTSVNSHVKVLSISEFLQIQDLRLPLLSESGAMPRRLSVFGNRLVLGTEKSSTSGELFTLHIEAGGMLSTTTSMEELGGQAHISRVVGTTLFTANSADPELRVFDYDMNLIKEYDAPLTLGNGKSLLDFYPYVILGRTLGSGELTLLDVATTSLIAIDTDRTNGSVDALQPIDPDMFMTFTSNPDKEIQFWKITEGRRLNFISSVNLPARVMSYACDLDSIYVAVIINEKPSLIILK